MAITLVETVGSDTANTWATLAEAEAYLEGRPNSTAWESADEEDQKAALVAAARRLSLERYRGLPVTATQALAFPRTGLYDDLGNEFASTAIPPGVKSAQIEEALAFIVSPSRQDGSALAGFDSIRIGPIALDTRAAAASTGALTSLAGRFLSRYRISTSGTIRLVRG